jgi:hypothetical protein
MDAIKVALEIILILQRVLPVSRLPDAAPIFALSRVADGSYRPRDSNKTALSAPRDVQSGTA